MPAGNPHKHRYKHGKQEEILSFEEINSRVAKTKLNEEQEAFFWLLYYCGVRKSEAYERTVEDCKITETHLIIDFPHFEFVNGKIIKVDGRKKRGAAVPPLEIPVYLIGVEKILGCVKLANRKKARFKNIYLYLPTGKTKTTKKGNVVEIKKRTKIRHRAKWVFPHIQSTEAWSIVKKILGFKYYPHFLRLNRLSEIGSDPEASLLTLKSFSGIKTLQQLETYLGVSKKEQKKAVRFMEEMQKTDV